ncbi:MAG: alanine--tRNA ligase [Patescibacteria group bacterium]
MKSADVRKKFIDFYKARGHVEIPSAPLVPENDPTTLFTSSGMQPLVPYLLGQPHPSGTRIVDSQKSFRAQDIEEVGDNRHTTFFEMLGNWSFGDYFKKEQLSWIFEFLTKELALDPQRLFVSVFSGEAGSGSAREGKSLIPKDTESIGIWKEIFAGVGIEAEVADRASSAGARIFTYNARKNWWSRSGEPEAMPAGEPGGPDSEVFFDFGPERGLHEKSPWKDEVCHPNCDCGRYMEIANSVFMQYQKQADGSLKELAQKNVDFGGGLERLVAVTNDDPDVFKIDIFLGIIDRIEKETHKKYGINENATRSMRIIADHLRASAMIIIDGVRPGKQKADYVLRKLLRRAMYHCHLLGFGLNGSILSLLCKEFQEVYPEVTENWPLICDIIDEEGEKFGNSLDRGLKKLEKYLSYTRIGGLIAFDLYQTDGFPLELTKEILFKKNQEFTSRDEKEFIDVENTHRELSRTAAKGMFKGGLADKSEQTVKLHTAHHLLLSSLQKIVDPNIKQRGSNITAERLRLDFNYGEKLTPETLMDVETLVNGKISENLPVVRREMLREEAEKLGAQMEFGHKYPERVSVYVVGPENDFFSAEFCGGPHVTATGQLGTFKIIKEESAGAGIRRIYATVDENNKLTK